jgi:hypothetical protein
LDASALIVADVEPAGSIRFLLAAGRAAVERGSMRA